MRNNAQKIKTKIARVSYNIQKNSDKKRSKTKESEERIINLQSESISFAGLSLVIAKSILCILYSEQNGLLRRKYKQM